LLSAARKSIPELGDIYDESPPTGQSPVNQAKNYFDQGYLS
jgi:hypothetical protein